MINIIFLEFKQIVSCYVIIYVKLLHGEFQSEIYEIPRGKFAHFSILQKNKDLEDLDIYNSLREFFTTPILQLHDSDIIELVLTTHEIMNNDDTIG